jgi:uncharacterized membrane protein
VDSVVKKFIITLGDIMSYNKEQWVTIVAASLFLIGAVFALFNVFGGASWALWVALVYIMAAIVAYLIVLLGKHIWRQKFTISSRELNQATERQSTTQQSA